MSSWLARSLRTLPWLAALVPPFLLARALHAAAYNVPYWDQWSYVPLFVETAQGHVPLSLLWAQVNEHRLFVPFVLQGLLAWATAWDLRAEVWLNFAVSLTQLALLAVLVRRTFRALAPSFDGVLVLLCSLYTFWFAPGRNWAWGPIMQANLVALTTVAIACVVADWQGRWSQMASLQALAIVGALSQGSATLLLAIAPLLIIVAPGAGTARWRQASASAVIGVAVLALYFWGWHGRLDAGPVPVPDPTLGMQVQYALAFLGTGFDGMDITRAAYWGGGGLGVAMIAGGYLLRAGDAERRAALAWSVLAIMTIGGAVLAALNRLPAGMHTAHLPRYIPLQVPFAESVVAVAAVAIASLARRRPATGPIGATLLVAALAFTAPAYVAASNEGASRLAAHGRLLSGAVQCLRPCAQATDACFRSICWDPQLARALCPQLETHHLGPFATP